MLVLVDSSCWVEYLRVSGDRQVRQTINGWLTGKRIAICAPVLAEVLRGVRKPDVRRVERTLGSLHYLETLEQDWREVVRCARALSDRAQHEPLIDLVVALVAHRNDAELAHRDRHYEAIAEVVPVRVRDLS